jgi:predicted porin
MNTAINGFANFTGAGTTNTQGSVDSTGADLIAGTFGGAHTMADAAAGGGAIAYAAAAGGGMQGRTPGVIQYTTPTFNGLRATVEYLSNSADSDGTLNDGDTSATQHGLVITYTAGPLQLAAATGKRTAEVEEVAAGAGNAYGKAEVNWLGGSYDFGSAKVFAAYGSRKDVSSANLIDTAIATTYDASVQVIGVNVPLGATTLFATAYDGENGLAAGTDDDREANGYQIGVRYAMSKRTSLYGVFGMDKNEDKTKAGTAQADSFKRTQSGFGIVHSF